MFCLCVGVFLAACALSRSASSVEMSMMRPVRSRISAAAGELLPLVYEELRKLAARKMANEPAGHTLQPTALVHEAYLKLIGRRDVQFDDRAHFFAYAASAMRSARGSSA